MKEKNILSEYSIRDYRDGDFDRISHLWELTGMGSSRRGDNEKTIEDSIKLGGALLILEEKAQGKFAEHRG